MLMDTFRSTEINFWTIPTQEVVIPVSDTVSLHLQGSQETSDVKKNAWDTS